jgi:eukaryotic-like serine/threonine-protein kinase
MAAAPRFGRFRLVELRGSGGMGEVWHAVVEGPRGFEQSVILKRIRRDRAADPGFIARLGAEARVCARLDHPAIVKVFELGEVDGEPYLAMELVDGWDLGAVIAACRQARRPLPIPFLCHVGAEIADALAHAHALRDEQGAPCGLVHRDVSPTNIMVTRQGGVKLLDFGVHTIRDRLPDERTLTGDVMGTVAYMSPEQADGRAVDGRSDQFSLGVVLHEALTGERLFRVPNDLETLRRVREAQVPAPSSLRPETDRAIDRVLLRMLARSPADRYASCLEVAAALGPHARRAGVDAAWIRSLLAELPLDGDARHAPRPGTERLIPEARSHWPWLLAAAITALVALPYLVSR